MSVLIDMTYYKAIFIFIWYLHNAEIVVCLNSAANNTNITKIITAIK